MVVLLDEAVDVPFAVGATLHVHARLAADFGGGSRVDRVVGLLFVSVADAGEFGVDELLGGSRSPAAEFGGSEAGGFGVVFVVGVRVFVGGELHLRGHLSSDFDEDRWGGTRGKVIE